MKTVTEIASKLNRAGVPPDFGPHRGRLLIRVLRALAKGRPVTSQDVVEMAAATGVSPEDSVEFLRQVTERDTRDSIIGLLGLSLNDTWSHRFDVNGVSFRTWCAWDTLFLPLLLEQTATIESDCPVSRKKVRLTVSPARVEQCSPEGAAVSIVVLDPERHNLDSAEAIWSNFCHQVYFFGSREEAKAWTADRQDLTILAVPEAYELGRRTFALWIAYGRG